MSNYKIEKRRGFGGKIGANHMEMLKKRVQTQITMFCENF